MPNTLTQVGRSIYNAVGNAVFLIAAVIVAILTYSRTYEEDVLHEGDLSGNPDNDPKSLK
jgi:hypothetical protein